VENKEKAIEAQKGQVIGLGLFDNAFHRSMGTFPAVQNAINKTERINVKETYPVDQRRMAGLENILIVGQGMPQHYGQNSKSLCHVKILDPLRTLPHNKTPFPP
jgi:hypothetical protein